MVTEPLGLLHQLQLLWDRGSVEKAKADFVHVRRAPACKRDCWNDLIGHSSSPSLRTVFYGSLLNVIGPAN
jgi:hypothetical protein